jgi:small subunit ribosomal protein S19|tara:strand:+ start:637 stop:1035 length:399 start_codon:yes stop_codon:yes gene_type:complete
MTRGVWKGPFVHPSLLKKIDKLKDQTKKMPIKTWSRNSTIIPEFVGHSFLIHNGKSFIPITVSEEMVGHKLGEFSPTRKFSGHTPADKKAAAEGTSSTASGSAPKAAPGSSPKTDPAAAPASKPASPKKDTK